MMPSPKAKTGYALCAIAFFVAPQAAVAHGAAHLPAVAPHASVSSPAKSSAMPTSSSPASSATATKGCADPALCALETETAAQSTITSSTPVPALPPQPFDAAAPAAPPVVAAPSTATLTPDVAVDSSSGGASRTGNPGATGLTLADCMAVWEPALHMSKVEWRATCARTLNGVELPPDTKTAHADGVQQANVKHVTHRPHRAVTSAMAKE